LGSSCEDHSNIFFFCLSPRSFSFYRVFLFFFTVLRFAFSFAFALHFVFTADRSFSASVSRQRFSRFAKSLPFFISFRAPILIPLLLRHFLACLVSRLSSFLCLPHFLSINFFFFCILHFGCIFFFFFSLHSSFCFVDHCRGHLWEHMHGRSGSSDISFHPLSLFSQAFIQVILIPHFRRHILPHHFISDKHMAFSTAWLHNPIAPLRLTQTSSRPGGGWRRLEVGTSFQPFSPYLSIHDLLLTSMHIIHSSSVPHWVLERSSMTPHCLPNAAPLSYERMDNNSRARGDINALCSCLALRHSTTD